MSPSPREETLEVLLANFREIHARVRETKARLEDTTTSVLKTFLYSTTIALALNLSIQIVGWGSGGWGSGSNNHYPLNAELLLLLAIGALLGSILGLISHYIWRIGNMADHLRDIASLLCLEKEITNLLKRNYYIDVGPLLGRTFIEEINKVISGLATQFWAVVNLLIPIWLVFILLYAGSYYRIFRHFDINSPMGRTVVLLFTLLSYLVIVIIFVVRCGRDSQQEIHDNNCTSCDSANKLDPQFLVILSILILLTPLLLFLSSWIPYAFVVLFSAPLGILALILSVLGYIFYRTEVLPVSIVIEMMTKNSRYEQGGKLKEMVNCAAKCIFSIRPTSSERRSIKRRVRESLKACGVDINEDGES